MKAKGTCDRSRNIRVAPIVLPDGVPGVAIEIPGIKARFMPNAVARSVALDIIRASTYAEMYAALCRKLANEGKDDAQIRAAVQSLLASIEAGTEPTPPKEDQP